MQIEQSHKKSNSRLDESSISSGIFGTAGGNHVQSLKKYGQYTFIYAHIYLASIQAGADKT